MDSYDHKDKIRSLINAWEDGKLNWQDMEAATPLIVKNRRKSRYPVSLRQETGQTLSGNLKFQKIEVFIQ